MLKQIKVPGDTPTCPCPASSGSRICSGRHGTGRDTQCHRALSGEQQGSVSPPCGIPGWLSKSLLFREGRPSRASQVWACLAQTQQRPVSYASSAPHRGSPGVLGWARPWKTLGPAGEACPSPAHQAHSTPGPPAIWDPPRPRSSAPSWNVPGAWLPFWLSLVCRTSFQICVKSITFSGPCTP